MGAAGLVLLVRLCPKLGIALVGALLSLVPLVAVAVVRPLLGAHQERAVHVHHFMVIGLVLMPNRPCSHRHPGLFITNHAARTTIGAGLGLSPVVLPVLNAESAGVPDAVHGWHDLKHRITVHQCSPFSHLALSLVALQSSFRSHCFQVLIKKLPFR